MEIEAINKLQLFVFDDKNKNGKSEISKLKTEPQKEPSKFDEMMRKVALIKPTKPKKNAKPRA